MTEPKRKLRGQLGAIAALLPVPVIFIFYLVIHGVAVKTNCLPQTGASPPCCPVSGVPGLPIDDAYIFDRYSTNLASGNGFSFNPGQMSFGCTSIVWPVIMTGIMKLTKITYEENALLLGFYLFSLAAIAAAWTVFIKTGNLLLEIFTGLMATSSVLLIMNAFSGMETPLTMALIALMAAVWLSQKPRPILAGVIAGLLTLNRPESLYFAVAPALLYLFSFAIGRKFIQGKHVAQLVVAWAVFAVPSALIIHHTTGYFLPTTHMGKIISASPGVLERGLLDRLGLAALSLGDGWWQLAERLRALAPVLAISILYLLGSELKAIKKSIIPAWTQTGTFVLAGYLLLPGVYGFSFPVGPPFGGYYLRYIAPVMILVFILAALGLHRIIGEGKKPWAAIALILALAYAGWMWNFQFKYAKEDFAREVRLNTGLRQSAADYIAKETPSGAWVLIGYTGLGVVGGGCNRYVLDQGALINPDIFDYYRNAKRTPEGKWEAVVKYMVDKRLDYYVTFAFPPELADAIPDPAATPGFHEVKRLGDLSEPVKALSQIRIYRFDADEYKNARRGTP